jgi:hypothetical protein
LARRSLPEPSEPAWPLTDCLRPARAPPRHRGRAERGLCPPAVMEAPGTARSTPCAESADPANQPAPRSRSRVET